MVLAFVVTGPRFAKSDLLLRSVAYREILIFFISFYMIVMKTRRPGSQKLTIAPSGIGEQPVVAWRNEQLVSGLGYRDHVFHFYMAHVAVPELHFDGQYHSRLQKVTGMRIDYRILVMYQADSVSDELAVFPKGILV